MVFANAYKLVAPSGFMINIFKKYGYDNIVLISNNLQILDYPFKLRNKIEPKILWVRSFASLYNPELAINAIAILKNEFPEAELCFVGPEKDGTMVKCKQKVVDLNLEKNISFVGKLEKSDWLSLSKDFDIFLNTTNVDNTPVSVMEAMALGMVVVSTNAGGVPYLIEDAENGYLYDVGDLEGLINTMRSVLQLDNGELSLNARKKAESWDWEIVKEQWKELFDELV
jgi:glycosyltransferase involved in cell wall biosynthesis